MYYLFPVDRASKQSTKPLKYGRFIDGSSLIVTIDTDIDKKVSIHWYHCLGANNSLLVWWCKCKEVRDKLFINLLQHLILLPKYIYTYSYIYCKWLNDTTYIYWGQLWILTGDWTLFAPEDWWPSQPRNHRRWVF